MDCRAAGPQEYRPARVAGTVALHCDIMFGWLQLHTTVLGYSGCSFQGAVSLCHGAGLRWFGFVLQLSYFLQSQETYELQHGKWPQSQVVLE